MTTIKDSKRLARQAARLRRQAIDNRDELSAIIHSKILEHPAVKNATAVGCFVSFRTEVETHELIARLLAKGKSVGVPWCDGDDLRLCFIESLDELSPGAFGILEPRRELRSRRDASINLLETILVPGLAFTAVGERLGYGRGYYDRLLAGSTVLKVGIAFDDQMAGELPMTATDILMDWIVTDKRIIDV